jgi:hypothetical protein
MRSLLLVCCLLLATEAFGCAVCVRQPLKFAFQDSALFFVGKVVQREQWTVTFEVLEQFHGQPADRVTLDTSNSCSISRFADGASYLVEATRIDGGLHAYLCSHTQLLDDDSPDLRMVRRRASWWNCRLGRISLYRFRHFLGRRLAG